MDQLGQWADDYEIYSDTIMKQPSFNPSYGVVARDTALYLDGYKSAILDIYNHAKEGERIKREGGM